MSTLTDFTPAPGAAPALQRVTAQAGIEWRLLMSNGEQLLLTIVIPVAVLAGVTGAGLAELDLAVPGVMALAVLASAFTATAISTGFERRSGVLKFLGTTPLARRGLLAGKVLATAAVVAIQLVVIAAAAMIMGWRGGGLMPLGLVATVALGTLALGSLGFTLAGILRAEATLAIANGIFLLLLVGGGTVLPADRLPDALNGPAQLLPSAALGDAMRAAFGQGTATFGLELLILAAWSVLGVAAATRWFRWE